MPTTIEVMEALQRAMKGTRDARGACVNPTHKHDTHLLVTGDMAGEPVAMLCWGENCGAPAHLDMLQGDGTYCHDDPDARRCPDMNPNFVNPCIPEG